MFQRRRGLFFSYSFNCEYCYISSSLSISNNNVSYAYHLLMHIYISSSQITLSRFLIHCQWSPNNGLMSIEIQLSQFYGYIDDLSRLAMGRYTLVIRLLNTFIACTEV